MRSDPWRTQSHRGKISIHAHDHAPYPDRISKTRIEIRRRGGREVQAGRHGLTPQACVRSARFRRVVASHRGISSSGFPDCHSERSRGISHCCLAVMSRDYDFWIYIVTNRNHSVLYIGVTNSLSRRIWEHGEEIGASFPATYRCKKLIYYEHYTDADEAFAREAQLKKW